MGSTSWAMTTNCAFFCSTNFVTVFAPERNLLRRFAGVVSFFATFASALAFNRFFFSTGVSGLYFANNVNNVFAIFKTKSKSHKQLQFFKMLQYQFVCRRFGWIDWWVVVLLNVSAKRPFVVEYECILAILRNATDRERVECLDRCRNCGDASRTAGSSPFSVRLFSRPMGRPLLFCPPSS